MIKIFKKLVNKFKGSLLRLTIGDALGVPFAFKIPVIFKLMKKMLGGDFFNLNSREWN